MRGGQGAAQLELLKGFTFTASIQGVEGGGEGCG